jgi:molybdate transport system ATP-binding protein
VLDNPYIGLDAASCTTLTEPLHGLDASNRKRVSQIISTFCDRKAKTLVYVTHCRNELPPCITHHFTLGN